MFPVALSFRPRCSHPECRLGLTSLLERLPTWHDAVGHVYIGAGGSTAIDVVLFLRAQDSERVDEARDAAVAALRERTDVVFDVVVGAGGSN